MIGKPSGRQGELFIPGSLESMIPDDHVLKRVDRVVGFAWLALRANMSETVAPRSLL